MAGAGTQSSSIAFGGSPPNYIANTESWNGTSWTEVNDLNTARNDLAGYGTSTQVLWQLVEDTGSVTAVTEFWNGTSWTEINDLSTARGGSLAGAGSAVSGVVFGGGTPAYSALTEEWNVPTANYTLTAS
jgi:hypothetical protein